jgi:hypothetical protein
MERLWTWGGEFFGYRDGDRLWTHDGRNVGRFHDDEIYGMDGRYLGEVKGDRLVTKRSKKSKCKSRFQPALNRVGIVKSVNRVGRVLGVGYEDFPNPEGV